MFWVHASTAESFEQAYKFIAAKLELPGWNEPKTDFLDLVSRWLSDTEQGRWLMILDGADDINVFRSTRNSNSGQRSLPLSSYIPQVITGSVLITTRDGRAASWLSTGYASAVRIKPMGCEDAEQLLCAKIPEALSTHSDRSELVEELEYMPLAITQAAAYISAKKAWMSVSEYLSLYRQGSINQGRLLEEDLGDLRRGPGVPNSVIRTWQISFDQIKSYQPQATRLLSLMSMLNCHSIPEILLCSNEANRLNFIESLALLDEFSLVTIENGGRTFEIHRLVQLATRKWLEQQRENEMWQGEAVKVMSKTFPTGNYSNWKNCETLLPHAQEVLKSSVSSDKYLLARGTLLYNMAWYSWLQGLYTNAITQSRKSLAIREQVLVDSDRRVLDSVAMIDRKSVV